MRGLPSYGETRALYFLATFTLESQSGAASGFVISCLKTAPPRGPDIDLPSRSTRFRAAPDHVAFS